MLSVSLFFQPASSLVFSNLRDLDIFEDCQPVILWNVPQFGVSRVSSRLGPSYVFCGGNITDAGVLPNTSCPVAHVYLSCNWCEF